MTNHTEDYFSHKLEFNLQKNPAKVSDRASLRFLLPGIVFSALLFLLGLYEMLNGFEAGGADVQELVPEHLSSDYQPLLTPLFFDIVFMIVGLGIFVSSIVSYLRYRKYVFDGKTMVLGYRSVLGAKTIVKEDIKNYFGVRMRIVFYQFGLINANKYIIELCNKNPQYNVPLYISTSPHEVRKRWKEYARYFKLPMLYNTDEGLISRNLKDLDKSVRQMVKLNLIKDTYDSYADLPDNIKYVRRKDKIVIKRRNVWDIYNLIAWIIIALVGVSVAVGISGSTMPEQPRPIFYVYTAAALFWIVTAVLILFRKEKLVIKKQKIVNTYKYMLYSTKHNEMQKDDIESIEVAENPATGRHFVSIISDNNTITFGSKLPIADLQWIKKFLIHEIIK